MFGLVILNASLLYDSFHFFRRIHDMDTFASIQTSWLEDPNIFAPKVASGKLDFLLRLQFYFARIGIVPN